jgi:hypothetical protein
MAQTKEEIKNILLAEKANQPTLDALTSDSATSIWRLWIDITSEIVLSVQKLYDALKAEINAIIDLLKPHTLKWYAKKAKAFMYGYNLQADKDTYDTTGLTEAQILAAKIIANAAVVEQVRGLRIKVTKSLNDDLVPLDAPQLNAFKEYMSRVKDAGVKLLITSGVADSLKLSLKIFYNPLVLNSMGARLDLTDNTPVQSAVKRYLKNLPFNGVLVTEFLTDELQKVEGVVIPHIMNAQAKYGALAFTAFDVQYNPDAGYLRIYDDADLVIEFIPQSQI